GEPVGQAPHAGAVGSLEQHEVALLEELVEQRGGGVDVGGGVDLGAVGTGAPAHGRAGGTGGHDDVDPELGREAAELDVRRLGLLPQLEHLAEDGDPPGGGHGGDGTQRGGQRGGGGVVGGGDDGDAVGASGHVQPAG